MYRLVGFNTPETGTNARCEFERALAAKATQRLRQLTAAGGLELELFGAHASRGPRALNDAISAGRAQY